MSGQQPILASGGVSFRVRRWAGWAPGLESTADWADWAQGNRSLDPAAPPPRPADVPAMLRRRTSPLSKAALQALYTCAEGEHHRRVVFASRHGELTRSTGLLEDLARQEPLSPNAFSLSVHNTVLGIYSIASANQAPGSAIAAGLDSLPAGVLEAVGYLQRGEPEVLLVVADDAVPDFYQPWLADEPPLMAVAMLLAPPDAEGTHWRLQAQPKAGAGEADRSEAAVSPLPAWLRLLAGGGSRLVSPGEQHDWCWERL